MPPKKRGRKRLDTEEWIDQQPRTQVLPDHIQKDYDEAKAEMEKLSEQCAIVNTEEELTNQEQIKLKEAKKAQSEIGSKMRQIDGHESRTRRLRLMIERQTEEMLEGSDNPEKEDSIIKKLDDELKVVRQEIEPLVEKDKVKQAEYLKLKKELGNLQNAQEQLHSHIEEMRGPGNRSNTSVADGNWDNSRIPNEYIPLIDRLSKDVTELRGRCEELYSIQKLVKSRKRKIEEKRDRLEWLKSEKELTYGKDDHLRSQIRHIKNKIEEEKNKLRAHHEFSKKLVESFDTPNDDGNLQ